MAAAPTAARVSSSRLNKKTLERSFPQIPAVCNHDEGEPSARQRFHWEICLEDIFQQCPRASDDVHMKLADLRFRLARRLLQEADQLSAFIICVSLGPSWKNPSFPW